MATTPSASKPSAAATTDEPYSIQLHYPVTIDGVTYESLPIRRPKVKDLLHAERQGKTQAEQEILQFASLAGVAPNVIEELDVKDYVAIQQRVQAFLS